MVAGPNPAEGSKLTGRKPYPKLGSKVPGAYKRSTNIVYCGNVRSSNRDIYNFPGRLKNHREALAKLRNGQTALAFLDHLSVLGLSQARVSKYATALRTLLKHTNFNPKRATKKDIERVVAWIQNQNYADWTKHDLKLTVRKFVQYARKGTCAPKTPLPSEVGWIPLEVKEKTTVTAEDILTPTDVSAILKHARNARDFAMIYSLSEGALRITELLGMTIGSVKFQKGYCVLSVDGKTGPRQVTVVLAYRALLDWINVHPYRNNLNAPLWVSASTNAECTPLRYETFRRMIKETAKKAEMKKRVWGYLFRHTQLTALAKKLPESQLKNVAGWTQSSKMAANYVHLCGKDNEDAILAIHGISNSEKEPPFLMMMQCPNCQTKNAPGTIRCSLCGLIIDPETARSINDDEDKKKQELLTRLEHLESLVSRALFPKAPP
jgi:integrase/recombinase XerD